MSQIFPAQRIAVLLESLDGGGAQRRVVELINAFVRAGRKVFLIVLESGDELRGQIDPSVRIIFVDRSSGSVADVSAAIWEQLSLVAPDALLLGATTVAKFALRSAPRWKPFPIILRASSHPKRTFPWALWRQRLLEPLHRINRFRRYARADLIIAVAEDVAASIHSVLPDRPIVTILNPVVSDAFLEGADRPIELPWRDAPSVPLILGVGRLAVAKDFPTLLRAFAELRKTRAARLVILGRGSASERRTLLRLADQLGVSDSFALPGPTDRVGAWLNHADLFVSSSLWEGASGALIEAVVLGCPVVATDCVGSARALLRDGSCGMLVPPRKPKVMANAMAVQLRRGRLRDSNAQSSLIERYGVEQRAREYIDAIDDCVQRFSRHSS